MGIPTIVMRAANLARSPQIRASSSHTSNWGLARLSFRGRTQTAVCSTLAKRIDLGQIGMDELYKFNPAVVGTSFGISTPEKMADLFCNAKEGLFNFPIESHSVVFRNYPGYNIAFFHAVKKASPDQSWEAAEKLVSDKNSAVGQMLRSINELYEHEARLALQIFFESQ